MPNSMCSCWEKQKKNRLKNSESMKLKRNSPNLIPLSTLQPTANPFSPKKILKIPVQLSITNIKPIWKHNSSSWKNPTTLKLHTKITTKNTMKPSHSKSTSSEGLKILWVKWKRPLKRMKSSILKTGPFSAQFLTKKTPCQRSFLQSILQFKKLTRRPRSLTKVGLKNQGN